jgi:hypothetical protein
MALTTLANYTTYVQRLLHDSSFQFWTQTELTDFINVARNRLVRDTGCVRVMQSVMISTQVEKYPFGSVTGALIVSGGSGYTSSPSVAITGGTGTGATASAKILNGQVNQVNITSGGTGYSIMTQGAVAPTITFTGGGGSGAAAVANVLDNQSIDMIRAMLIWGTTRIALSYRTWGDFNSVWRYTTQFIGRPQVVSLYAYNTAYVAPPPDQPYLVEWDTVCLPLPLIDSTTPETIPFVFQEPIPYYAAYMAKIKAQNNKEADEFLQRYKQQRAAANASVFTKRTRSEYMQP